MSYQDYQRITPEGYIRVVNSADYDPIISYTPLPDITVFVDAVVNLPNTVEATFKSGKVETMVVKWERVNVDTSIAGTQKIYGDIGNGAAAVLQNVIVNELSDLDILRQIRDANPASQLPSLWLDSEDPYTQWEGVNWNAEKTIITELDIYEKSIMLLPNVNKLNNVLRLDCGGNQLTSLDVSGLSNLLGLGCDYNQLSILNLDGLISLQDLYCPYNQLVSLPTLTSKGAITTYDFTFNNFSTTELDRFRAMGFTDESKLLPQNP